MGVVCGCCLLLFAVVCLGLLIGARCSCVVVVCCLLWFGVVCCCLLLFVVAAVYCCVDRCLLLLNVSCCCRLHVHYSVIVRVPHAININDADWYTY